MSVIPNPGQIRLQALLAGPQRHTLAAGGARCVAGSTIIDGQTETIAELAARGDPVEVATSWGMQWAEAPFKKGRCQMLRVVLGSGLEIEVTPDHRFWDGRAWIKAETLSPGDRVARTCSASPAQSSSGHGLSRWLSDALHWKRTLAGWMERCFDCCRRYDQPLRQALTAGPRCHASQFDAAAHSPLGQCQLDRASGWHGSDSRRDHLSRRAQADNRRDLEWCRRSRTGGSPSSDRRSLSSARAFGQTCARFLGLHQKDQQFPARSYLSLLVSAAQGFCVRLFFRCAYLLNLTLDTPLRCGYQLCNVLSITSTTEQEFYTLHVPVTAQYFANGFLNHNSGKTFWLCRAMALRAIKAAESRHAILRFHNNAVWTSIGMDTMPKVMRLCFPDVPYTIHKQDGFFKLVNGSEIWLAGLDDEKRVDKILGTEFVTLYFVECSQIPYSSVLVARTRLAQLVPGLTQRAYYDLNPVGKTHWTNIEFGDGRSPADRKPLADAANYKRIFVNPSDNAINLSPEFLAELQNLPPKQRKRFFEGVYVDEVEGALWTYELIERQRCTVAEMPELRRIVVAVDPSGAAGKEDVRSDEIGIVAAGLGIDGRAYLLDDASLRDGPAVWGKVAVNLYKKRQADRIIAERNFGGEMVRFTVKAADPDVPVVVVSAAGNRGKHIRAEPVAALYESDKIKHVGRFPDLEDQLVNFSTSGYVGERSPDRADAMVWAMTDLLLTGQVAPIVAPIVIGPYAA